MKSESVVKQPLGPNQIDKGQVSSPTRGGLTKTTYDVIVWRVDTDTCLHFSLPWLRLFCFGKIWNGNLDPGDQGFRGSQGVNTNGYLGFLVKRGILEHSRTFCG